MRLNEVRSQITFITKNPLAHGRALGDHLLKQSSRLARVGVTLLPPAAGAPGPRPPMFAIGFAIRSGAELGNWEIARGEDWRFDAGEDLGSLRPGIVGGNYGPACGISSSDDHMARQTRQRDSRAAGHYTFYEVASIGHA